MITVFLINDHAPTRAVLRLRLELEPDILVIGDGGHDASAIAKISDLVPDVVILDVTAPIHDQTSEVRLLSGLALIARVVVLSLYDDPATRISALAAGANALISKHDSDDELLDAIRAAATPPNS